ncbi:excisionase [Cronobacter malonaticus]|uniref:excisionase n=1 Tax=Cronobacter malonaticus TaxID=413503 RepID=UPI000907A9DE|nr:excisionase [Cronobacter malonaticus]EGT4370535.1 excisionase [Cronobacter malonaticus]MDI6466656.1 excisionase [Cronobacter malonaticus]HAU5448944.1 excisionase [Cronobacter malonaticus]
MQFITLTTWAKKTYPDNPPALVTLRRWARNGNIYPPPERHGREYRVTPDAFYISTKKAGASLVQHHPNGRKGKPSPLLEKLINESKKI